MYKLTNTSWNKAVVFFAEEIYEFQTHTRGKWGLGMMNYERERGLTSRKNTGGG
jgi:hypothetical protein